MDAYKKWRWFQTYKYWTNLRHLGAPLSLVIIRSGDMSGRGGSYTRTVGLRGWNAACCRTRGALSEKCQGTLSATLYCLNKAALVNLFSIFKTAPIFCQDHNFCLLTNSLAKTIRIIYITTEVFCIFWQKRVWEVCNVRIRNVFTDFFTNFEQGFGKGGRRGNSWNLCFPYMF